MQRRHFTSRARPRAGRIRGIRLFKTENFPFGRKTFRPHAALDGGRAYRPRVLGGARTWRTSPEARTSQAPTRGRADPQGPGTCRDPRPTRSALPLALSRQVAEHRARTPDSCGDGLGAVPARSGVARSGPGAGDATPDPSGRGRGARDPYPEAFSELVAERRRRPRILPEVLAEQSARTSALLGDGRRTEGPDPAPPWSAHGASAGGCAPCPECCDVGRDVAQPVPRLLGRGSRRGLTAVRAAVDRAGYSM